ncbi:imidazole glycerol phosphate synthase subunit HisH [bacterium]|nr:imidazole glycerol phosphate synthase subunit HisH [bacterium]
MIAIIDYGVGNLFSLSSSLKYLSLDCQITSDPSVIKEAEKLILPGVGAFGDAMKKLEETNLIELIINQTEKGKPLLGICLGMQMLFDYSLEYGKNKGLGLINGCVSPLKDDLPINAIIPQMGWNGLNIAKNNQLLKYVKENDDVYFVHSYYAKNCLEHTIATADYYLPVTAAVAKANVFGTQFHPEKSGKVGLNILKAFSEVN